MQKAIHISAILGIGLVLTTCALTQAPVSHPISTTSLATTPRDQCQAEEKPDTIAHGAEIGAVIAAFIGAFAACFAVFYYREQARAATQEHLNNVHQLIFDRLDASDVRAARHYIYSIDLVLENGKLEDLPPLNKEGFTYQKEHWVSLGTPGFTLGTEEERKCWQDNKNKAERVARALDQLGYLVREGIVPLNVVARFYTYPTLKCWYKLSPYIAATRFDRKQFGHMWEWENLVNKIIAGSRENNGVWEGTLKHDNLEEYAKKIAERVGAEGFPQDMNWNPPDLSK